MNIKTTLSVISIAAALIVAPVTTFAQSVTAMPVNQQNLTFMQNLYPQLKNFETQNTQYAQRGGIVITGISGSIITGTQTNKTTGTVFVYTVNAASAIIVRRFWGQSSLSQISVGDRIRVIGTWEDNAKTTINAFLIRDMSIQEKNDTFGGIVTTLGNNSFTFQSLHRGSWTVNITGSTVLSGRKNVSMQFANIQVHDKLRIDGMIDRANKIITASTILDMSYQ
jgi:hypothetical protein